MTQKIPWLRVFVEGVVIVGSILLAFAIDAWWTEYQEREDEQNLVLALMEDIRVDSVDYEQFATRQRGRAIAADLLLSLAGDPGVTGQFQEAASSGITPPLAFQILGLSNRLETVVVSYDEMTGVGGSSLIDDAALRREISSYYALARDRSDINDSLRPEAAEFRQHLAELGYAYTDGERIPAERVLEDEVLRARIRNMRTTADRAARYGVEMLEAATGLLHQLGPAQP